MHPQATGVNCRIGRWLRSLAGGTREVIKLEEMTRNNLIKRLRTSALYLLVMLGITYFYSLVLYSFLIWEFKEILENMGITPDIIFAIQLKIAEIYRLSPFGFLIVQFLLFAATFTIVWRISYGKTRNDVESDLALNPAVPVVFQAIGTILFAINFLSLLGVQLTLYSAIDNMGG